MSGIRDKLEQMARTPRQQLKRLIIGTVAALFFALALMLTSDLSSTWLFYLLAAGLIAACLYGLPGYLGIWLWRLRRILFDIED